MLEHQIYGDISRMEFQRLVMRCVERTGGAVLEMHSGGMMRFMRQYQGRKMYTRQCVRTVLRRIRGGIKAMREKAKEAFTK